MLMLSQLTDSSSRRRAMSDNTDGVGRDGAESAIPSGTPAWVTPALVARTIEVWQPHYPEPLTVEDAVEMVMAVGRLFGDA
jgi:hypothetical protein